MPSIAKMAAKINIKKYNLKQSPNHDFYTTNDDE